MLDVLPRRALFEFEIPVLHRERIVAIDGDLGKWPERYLLPPLVEVEDELPFADVYCAWHEEGLYFAFAVPDKPGPVQVDPQHWWKKDGVRICVATREARDIRRATRFCHFFYVLPSGGGPRRKDPVVGLHRMSRAKEPPPEIDLSRIRAGARFARRSYTLEVAIPAECLYGWDPEEHHRIGLFYKVKDTHLGGQHLTADDELGWNADPSTWATGVLVR